MDGANLSQSMSAVDSDDELSFLPQSLLQSVKAKEQRTLDQKETGFADQVKRQKLIASLPSTFDVIFLIYQSGQWSVMTKQELIHKIIASSTKVMDRSEVEEQLVLLEEFIPDWISEKTSRSGDVLCCIDATLSQADLRQRLLCQVERILPCLWPRSGDGEAQLGSLSVTGQVHGFFKKCRMEMNSHVQNALTDMYAKRGSVSQTNIFSGDKSTRYCFLYCDDHCSCSSWTWKQCN
jgi:hypothetical protein